MHAPGPCTIAQNQSNTFPNQHTTLTHKLSACVSIYLKKNKKHLTIHIIIKQRRNTKGVIGAPAAAGGGGAMGGGAAAPMGGVMAGGAPAQGGQFAFQQNAPVEQGVG